MLGPWVGTYITVISLLTYVVVNWQLAILSAVPNFVALRPWLVLSVFAGLFALCSYGMTLIRIDSNMTELTKEGSAIRVAYETVDENMAGAMSMVIMVDTHTSDGLYNPRLMQAMDQPQNRIETRYSDQVTRTNSLANIVKDTYQIMSDDDPPIIGAR